MPSPPEASESPTAVPSGLITMKVAQNAAAGARRARRWATAIAPVGAAHTVTIPDACSGASTALVACSSAAPAANAAKTPAQ